MRPLRTLLASFRRGGGGGSTRPRDVQERADLHRLFLYTRLYDKQGGGLNGGGDAKQLADAVLREAAALEEQGGGGGSATKEAVAAALRKQALALARAVHEALVVDGKDPGLAAAALREWGRRSNNGGRRRSGARPMARPGSDETDESDGDDDDEADVSSLNTSQKQALSAQELAHLAARRVGFGLRVGPSRVGHSEAGMGLFVAAPAAEASTTGTAGTAAPRAVVPAGALLALFPGLCYSRDDYRRMPGYPKVDRGNPYLAARYDGVVVDSQPWARGDGAVVVGVAGSAATVAASNDDSTSTSQSGLDPFRPRRQALPRTFLARMARASDGPKLPPAVQAALDEAAAARLARAMWCSPTTDEATALEFLAGGLPLEGRNPYALAHFANHPQPGEPPNAMIAPLDFFPEGVEEEASSASSASSSSSLPELRAYLPFCPYEAAAALTVWPVERALKKKGEDAAIAVARRLAAGRHVSRGAAELVTRGARGLGLVALRPLAEGEEVVFDYRLSPGMLGRPSWYVPCDEGGEDRRWA
jgi:hypothetical protein